MKTYSRFFIVAAAFMLSAACNSLDDLQERVDRIEGRVTALEKVAEAVNGNIQSLQAIAEGQAINKVEEKDGAYILTLSNGTTLTLQQGSIGMGKAPLMSIDKDGYWIAADEFDYKLFVFYKVVKNETAVKNLKAGDTVYYDITKEELEVLAAKSDKNSDETGEENKSGNGDESSSGSGSSSSGYGPYAIIRSLKVGETEIFSVKNFNDFIKDNYRLSVIGGSVVSVIAIVTTLVSLVFVIIFTVKGKYAPKTFVYTEDSSDSSSDNSDGAVE